MSDEARVSALLEEALDSQATPDQVCADAPELLSEVRRRWEQCRQVEAALEALFPSSVPSETGVGLSRPWAQLPHVPGYEVEGVIGRGGVGVVYKARHLKLKRTVAIKMLLSGAYASRVEVARFLQEARAVAALRHPHVVQLYDVGECDGLPYYTMEYLEAGTLADRLNGAPQPAKRAVSMLTCLADAVEAAHQGGIIHRDLKPGNVLLATDGSPKISDFGLARQLENADPSLTVGTGRIGTPSYMAPEQAGGNHGAVGPATDVYALGAILYEMLTGRAPFRGESASDTERQVLHEAPVRPSRLNPRTPRDLETICLKCLSKDAEGRYATAAELREDLLRFQHSEPILARRTGWIERAAKWAQRRPALATGCAAGLLLAALLSGVTLRGRAVELQRRALLETDLHELADLETWQQWTNARATLQRAQARLDVPGMNDLRQRLAVVQRDLELVDRLDAIHLRRATSGGLPLYRAKADHDYAQAFLDAGLTRIGEPLERAAPRIVRSPVRPALVAALDDWALSTSTDQRRRELFHLANLIDPQPKDTPVRELAARPGGSDLSQATAELDVTGCSVSALLVLGERQRLTGRDSRQFLRRVQLQYPADFWTNLTLGDALLWREPDEAAMFYRAALAARPDAAVGYVAVGDALVNQGNWQQGVDYFQRALRMNPNLARAQTELGRALRLLGQDQKAFDCDRAALRIDPDYAWAHLDMARFLMDQNRLEAAAEQFRYVVAASPRSPEVQTPYRAVMLRLGRGEQAWQQWKQGLDSQELDGWDAWNGYAELSLYLGHTQEYRRARRQLLQQFGDRTHPRVAEPLARACLLLDEPGADQQQAIAIAERADAADHSQYSPYSAFAKGLAEYRAGRYALAMQIVSGPAAHVLGPCPGMVKAMALWRQHDPAAARAALAGAGASWDWTPARADRADLWIYHILRRQAEAMILQNTSDGDAGPLPSGSPTPHAGRGSGQR